MRLNPELRRYLWLELSPVRLVAMPLVLGALFLLVGAWTHEAGQPWGGELVLEAFVATGSGVVVLLMLFWGARLAAHSVVREVGDRTWDQQRLGSVGAWTMAWGKLAGSTVYVTYGCLIALAVAVVSLVLLDGAYGGVASAFGAPLGTVLVQLVLGLVAFAVLVTAAVMLAAMTTVGRRESGRQLDVSLAQILVLVVAYVAFSAATDLGYGKTISWYGRELDAAWFAVASLVAFAAWSVVGLWRRMRVELQVRTWPAMWPLFVLFAGGWSAGFVAGTPALVVLAGVILLAGYVPAVLEPLDPVRLRRLVAAVAARDVAATARFVPLWLVSHVIAAIAVAVAVGALMASPHEGPSPPFIFGLADAAAGGLVAAWLFVSRDLLLLVLARLSNGGRRAFATWLLWMVLLYGVAPMILAAFGLYGAMPVVLPLREMPFGPTVPAPLLWPLLQAAAVAGIFFWRWRRHARLMPA